MIAFSESPGSRYGKVPFDENSKAEQVFCCIWDLESDVNNGGFHQYYFNSTGDHALRAVQALAAIGAHHMAAIVREANSLFPDAEPALDRSIRQEQLPAFPEAAMESLHELTLQFFKYPDKLTDLLYDYIISHRAEIQGAALLGRTR